MEPGKPLTKAQREALLTLEAQRDYRERKKSRRAVPFGNTIKRRALLPFGIKPKVNSTQ